ncbi:glycosyltransferase [Synechococcus sp. CS-1331]|uniref:glycosyltransferase family 2 protein n=1 Tax=Synechococcus sp. CS-1331 TaxID=2847973 RepID=UPI00223C117C|nr:glycosyltransferase [Synechococcus sp. CS-1331]MCT0227565.1 glycosyltransferase [Synechococcus sp. CS-1331]
MNNLQVPFNGLILSICIVSYKRPAYLRLCLDSIAVSLRHLEPKTYEVLVSDDCPNQSALQVVNDYDFTKWIPGPCRGVAANRNNVVNAATGEWILFIDDDEIADQDWLLFYKQAIISGKYDVLEGRVQPTNFPDSILWYAPSISSGGAYCTANMAIRRSTFQKLGGFDETFSVSHEDVDFGLRIRNAGCCSLYIQQAVVFHPARRYTFKQVWNRLLDLQCQSYFTHFKPPYNFTFVHLFRLISFSIKYWFRITRFEISGRQGHQWRRQLQAMVLLTFSSPVATIRLFNAHLEG